MSEVSEQRLPWAALLVLTSAVFMSAATETMPIGLLPLMATSFGVDETAIGLLVSVYAAAVVVASVPLNAWTAHLPRRPLLMSLVAVYGISNVVVASTDTYGIAAAARVLCGCSHALFFAVVFGYAAAITPVERLGTAMTAVGLGTGVALAIGTPVASLVGAVWGWRVPFWAVAVVSALVVLAIRIWIPALPGSTVSGGGQLVDVLRRPAFRWLEVATLLTILGVFALFTYQAPLLIEFGYTTHNVGRALMAYGVAVLVGVLVLGRLADTLLRPMLVAVLAALSVIFVVIGVAPKLVLVGTVLVVAWGLAMGPVNAYVQTAIVRAGGEHAATASAVHNSVFNIGIAGGSFLGGRILLGGEPHSIAWVAAVIIASSIVLWWRFTPAAAPAP